MSLTTLHIQEFRNLRDIQWKVHSGLNVLEGDNAQGKTNILEAIYFLANGKSFRSVHWENLIPWEKPSAHWEGRVQHQDLETDIRVFLGSEGKTLSIKGKPQRGWSKVGAFFRVLVFTPESTGLFRSAPATRRRYFDHSISLLHPPYASLLNRYQKLLRQRNQMLQEGKSDELLEGYDLQWAQLTQQISALRREYLGELLPLWTGRLEQLSQRIPSLGAQWEGPLSEEALQEERLLLEQLRLHRREERRWGHTRLGPHREDIQLTFAGHPVREVASQGQHRILVIALKVAQADRLRKDSGHSPVFLLDDLGSELDAGHLSQLLGLLEDLHAQTILTTAQRGSLAPLEAPTQRVAEGRIGLL